MDHQFNIGDTVQINHTSQEATVEGFSRDGKLLQVNLTPEHGKLYVPLASVTLVRAVSAGQGEVSHPGKIET